MSEETKEASAAAAPAATAPKSSPMILIGVIAVALVAGAVLGGTLVGPRLVAGRTAAPAAKHEDEKAKAQDEHPSVYKLDNVIVNPAGSQGMHFLMVSIAIEVPNTKMEAQLKSHEAELRDLAISILERQTMESLNQPGPREA